MQDNSRFSFYANVIGLIVIVFFAIVFITLAICFFKAKNKLIENKLEDDDIQINAIKEFDSLNKNKDNDKNIRELYKKKQKQNKIASNVSNVITAIFAVVLLGFLAFASCVKINNQEFWLGNSAFLVVQTSSMQEANKSNKYLFDENGKANEKDRVYQYSFVQISKDSKYIDNIKPYDIVAFKMLSQETNSYITIIHRLISVSYNDKNEPLYTFRGDANSISMPGETKITKDKIVGVLQTEGFSGIKNVTFGYFVSFLQSTIGVIALSVSFLVLVLYGIFCDKLTKTYNERYNKILNDKIDNLLYLENIENQISKKEKV